MIVALLDMFKKRCAACTKVLGGTFLAEGKLRFCSTACKAAHVKKKKSKKTCEFC